ncbi:MAG TPA: hypothetical protein VHB25_16845 [Gemmatimonadaceae bacterium]|nr:hypothetical protein [Gemmatimonadaceae bacterium]
MMQAQGTGAPACAGQRIDSVRVHTAAPTAAQLRRVPVVAHLVRAVHTTTHAQLIRRFLLLQAGDACDELRRTESERIIRAQPFVADASITVLPDTLGGVILDVQETDEIALVMDVAVGPGVPPLRFLRVGDENFSGAGIYIAGDWRSGGPFRDGYGGEFVDNQLFGRPYTFTASGHQTPLGGDWLFDATHPFYTDIQRIAWRARSGASDDYAQFWRDRETRHAIRVRQNYFDVGGIVRLGPPGRLSLFGASISGTDERTGTEQVLVTPSGFAQDSNTTLLNRFVNHRIARANALWGIRDIGFVRVRGFDALTAVQDMPIGFQLGTLFGRSLSVLGSRDDDIFMAGDMYVGAAGRNNALRLQLEGEGRRNNDIGVWDGILATGRAVEYFKADRINTSLASLEFSGEWRPRMPVALSLGDPEGGVRGYIADKEPGARRLVARLEHRVFLGRPFKLGDFGMAAFADAGKLWAGDAPFGVTTPIRTSVGLSFLATVPPASGRLWRVDFAFAQSPGPGGSRLEIRFTGVDKTTFFLPDPGDVRAARERTVPSSIFRWPQ